MRHAKTSSPFLASVFLAVLSAATIHVAHAAITVPSDTQTFISNIHEVKARRTALFHELKPNQEDDEMQIVAKLDFGDMNPCLGAPYLTAESVGFKDGDDAFIVYLQSLQAQSEKRTFFHVTMDSCEVHYPQIRKIEPCRSGICPDKYIVENKLWLNSRYEPAAFPREILYYVNLPLPWKEEKQLWEVNGWYGDGLYEEKTDEEPAVRAFVSHTDQMQFEDRRFIGEFTRYYPTGEVMLSRFFDEKGRKQGDLKVYYRSGKLKNSQHFQDDQLEGSSVTYYENGQVESSYVYHAGKHEDGLCLHYFEDGTLSRKHTYLDGAYHGEYVDYFPGGVVKEEHTYRNGKIVGQNKVYRSTGALEWISHYNEHGRLDGEQVQYFENGKPEQRNVFVNGEQREYQRWSKDGVQSVDWRWGPGHKYEGEQKDWHPNGHLSKSRTYRNDILDGVSKEWYENGQLRTEARYQQGKMMEFRSWADTGKLRSHSKYDENGDEVYSHRYHYHWDEPHNLYREEISNLKTGERKTIEYDDEGNVKQP